MLISDRFSLLADVSKPALEVMFNSVCAKEDPSLHASWQEHHLFLEIGVQ